MLSSYKTTDSRHRVLAAISFHHKNHEATFEPRHDEFLMNGVLQTSRPRALIAVPDAAWEELLIFYPAGVRVSVTVKDDGCGVNKTNFRNRRQLIGWVWNPTYAR